MANNDNKHLNDASNDNQALVSIGFEAVLDRIKSALGVNSDGELSNKFGIRRQTISQARKNGKVPPKWFFQVSEMTGCSIDWLRTGEDVQARQPEKPATDTVSEANSTYYPSIDIEHFDIIKQFKDKKLAKEISQDLLELESLNPEQYRVIGARIKGLVEGMKLGGGGTDRRKRSRRQLDADGKKSTKPKP